MELVGVSGVSRVSGGYSASKYFITYFIFIIGEIQFESNTFRQIITMYYISRM